MTSPRDPLFDQRIADWLEDDPDHAPVQALDIVLAAVPSIPQRRALRVPWRFPTMTTPIRLATAAVIGVLAVGGTLYLIQPDRSAVGGPGPSTSAPPVAASPSAQPAGSSPSAEASPAAASAWKLTGAPSVDRGVNGITIPLLDGRVLVAGGGTSPLDSAEMYDPKIGVWTATGSMSEARTYPVAVRLVNGKVLVAGGDNGTTNLDSAELFDPATGAWTPTSSMNEPRQQAFAALLSDGKVLVAGADTNEGLKQSAEIFDPGTGRWTPTGGLTIGRAGPLAATLLRDGRVLVGGGFTDDKRSAELYDPKKGTWTATGRMNAERVDQQTAVVLSDGKVLMSGGQPGSADVFDPKTGTWTATGALINMYTDVFASVVLPDGTVLLVGAGGTIPKDGPAVAERFDPATGQWSADGSLSTAWFVRSATSLGDGHVLVVGSVGADAGAPSAEVYDPTP